jgi:hypothetical protein
MCVYTSMCVQVIIFEHFKVVLCVIGMFLCIDNLLQTTYAFGYLMWLLNLSASCSIVTNLFSFELGVFRRLLLSLLLVWNGEVCCRKQSL